MSSLIRTVSTVALLLLLGVVAILVALKYKPSVDVDSAQVLYSLDAAATPGLRAEFFGTSTLSLSDGVNTIMIDGFFSRPSFYQLLTKIEPDTDAIAFALSKTRPKIDAIFVSHSHHDHSMDSGLVAIKTGAVVIGSESTLNIARGQNTPENQLRVLKVRNPMQFGQFKVTAYETPHSPEPINTGLITAPVHTPANLSDYRMAENFSFYVEHPLGRVLIVPSANFIPHTFDGLKADMVVLGVGTLGKQTTEFTETYWSETVGKTGAKLVIPVHWDDFTLSLREPLAPLPLLLDNLEVSMAKVNAMAKRDGVNVRFLPSLEEVALPAR